MVSIYYDSYYSADTIWEVVRQLQEIKFWKITHDLSRDIFDEAMRVEMDFPEILSKVLCHLFESVQEEVENEMHIFTISTQSGVEIPQMELERMFYGDIYCDDFEVIVCPRGFKITVMEYANPNGDVLEGVLKVHQYVEEKNAKGDHNHF